MPVSKEGEGEAEWPQDQGRRENLDYCYYYYYVGPPFAMATLTSSTRISAEVPGMESTPASLSDVR